jgi:hypothetical protein
LADAAPAKTLETVDVSGSNSAGPTIGLTSKTPLSGLSTRGASRLDASRLAASRLAASKLAAAKLAASKVANGSMVSGSDSGPVVVSAEGLSVQEMLASEGSASEGSASESANEPSISESISPTLSAGKPTFDWVAARPLIIGSAAVVLILIAGALAIRVVRTRRKQGAGNSRKLVPVG